jgi:hypothetical protein
MPPEIVGEVLVAPVGFPRAFRLERRMVQEHHTARSIAVRRAQRPGIDRVRAAVDGVQTAVAALCVDRFRLDDLDDLRLARVRLGVNHMEPRRAQAGNQQIAPLQMRVRHGRAERGGAGVPAEVMQFIARVRHVHASHDLAVVGGLRVHIQDRERVRTVARRVDHRDIREFFARRFHRHFRRRVESRVGFKGTECHSFTSPLCVPFWLTYPPEVRGSRGPRFIVCTNGILPGVRKIPSNP